MFISDLVCMFVCFLRLEVFEGHLVGGGIVDNRFIFHGLFGTLAAVVGINEELHKQDEVGQQDDGGENGSLQLTWNFSIR